MLESNLFKLYKNINQYGNYEYNYINDQILIKKDEKTICNITCKESRPFIYNYFCFKIYLPDQDVFEIQVSDDKKDKITVTTIIQTLLLGYDKILTPYQILTKNPNDIICFEKYDGVQSVHKQCSENTKFNDVFSKIRIFFDKDKLYNVSNKYFLIYEHAEQALTVQKNNLQNV